jgi:ABC-type uncharacterized transport system substrate-binding protein
MTIDIDRRQFISALSGAGVAWPLTARAQQPTMPVIGYLDFASPEQTKDRLAAFNGALSGLGYVDGKNVVIDHRSVFGQYDRLPAMAADLVQSRVALMIATGTPAVLAAKAASATIPIVFTTAGDPVKLGIVASLSRPGGNITGVAFLVGELGAKQFGLLHELAPKAVSFGLMLNSNNQQAENELKNAPAAARTLGLEVTVARASSEGEIETAFESFVQHHADAVVVGADGYFTSRREQIIALAARHGLPAIYALREFVEAGGLMSYGTDVDDAYRQAGIYTGRILKGDKPSDLPVVQSTKFELVINLKTAKTLGLTVPMTLQAAADAVIE